MHYFGDRVKMIREQRGRTIKDVAGACELSVSYWYDIEKNRTIPTLPVIAAIATELGVEPWYIIFDSIDLQERGVPLRA